jgi:hypothetical protein
MDSAKLVFHARCGNGHDTLQVFTRAPLRQWLAAGAVMFRCGECGSDWQPTVEERVRLRALAKPPLPDANLSPGLLETFNRGTT